MRLKLEMLLSIKDKKFIFTTKDGETVNPATYLVKRFNLKEGDSVIVLLKADNGKEEQPFDIEKAKQFTSRKLGNVQFATTDGRPVKLYTASAAGDYPVVGLDPDNMPCCWDAEGKPQNGKEELALVILEK